MISALEAENSTLKLTIANVRKQDKTKETKSVQEKIIASKPITSSSKKTTSQPKEEKQQVTSKKAVSSNQNGENIVRRTRRGKSQLLGLFDNDEDVY